MKFSVNSRRGKVKHLDSEGSLTPSPIWVDNDNERRRKYLPLEKGLRRGTLETQQIFIRLETEDFFFKVQFSDCEKCIAIFVGRKVEDKDYTLKMQSDTWVMDLR